MPNSRKIASGPLKGKTVLLGVTGSIAVYKACDLLRRLKDEGADVRCLMTESAQKFVTPLTFGALSGNPVLTGIWDETLWRMGHLQFSESADLFIIAPVSAQTLAKLAAGMAEDVVCATALALKCPVLLAPAMHEAMWQHPATQSNVKRLKGYGHHFVGPDRGPLSQGNSGWGRLAATPDILVGAKALLRKRN